MGVVKFSRYEIRGELGQGGMATVYRAYDPMFEREVALKILKRESLQDQQVRDRFERETKIIARLEHAAIVPVYDVGRDNEQLFFVMRYMTGGSLTDRIQKGTLSLYDVAIIIQRLGAALDYAHARGVIHRDLKPGNILFDGENNAYISDFGIAKLAQSSTKITNSGIIGTPTHMSPEQARGENVDGRSDIYSLGVILFEMLSGHTPFEATTPLGMVLKHATEPPPRILDINPDLPPGVEAVIRRVLSKKREHRYNSGTELANAFIDTLAKPLTSEANRIPLPASPAQPNREVEEVLMLPRSHGRTVLRRPWVWAPSALILLALAALAYETAPQAPDPPPTLETVTTTVEASPPTALPTASPTALPPTGTATAPAVLDPGIGGANKIALTADNEIYLLNMDGSDIQPLTRTRVPKFDLQWLPGGKELLYSEGKCVFRIDVESVHKDAEQLLCFNDPDFAGFRVSPDGKWVAISIAHRLLVLPFEIEALGGAPSTFELQGLESLCLDYAEVTVKDAQWSDDGRRLAIRYQSVLGNRLGNTVRVIGIDLDRCQEVASLIWDEFPAGRFLPEGYERYPLLPSYDWDGGGQFVFNTFIRNKSYGELYLYDMATEAARELNPIDGVCCYGSAIFSPDDTHILFVFQDVRHGANSENQLYYVPLAELGTGAEVTPIRLPRLFFRDLRENIQLALRPAMPRPSP